MRRLGERCRSSQNQPSRPPGGRSPGRAAGPAARHWTFDRAALGGLSAFVAPPGYLLSEGLFEALQRQGRPVVWVRLGPEDRDPGTFLRTLSPPSSATVPASAGTRPPPPAAGRPASSGWPRPWPWPRPPRRRWCSSTPTTARRDPADRRGHRHRRRPAPGPGCGRPAVGPGGAAWPRRGGASRRPNRPAGCSPSLLGQLKVRLDDVPVEDWPSGRGRSLFKYLVTRRGQGSRWEVLMDVLWPDAARRRPATA